MSKEILLAKVIDSTTGRQALDSNLRPIYEVIDSPATVRIPVPGYPKVGTRGSLNDLKSYEAVKRDGCRVTSLTADYKTGTIKPG